MTGRIILVRHGETAANRAGRFAGSDDIPLSSAGRRQVQKASRQFKKLFTPDLLLSSTLLRARQTSALLGLSFGLETEVLAGIHEREFGCLEGQSYARMGELALSDHSYDPAAHWTWAPPFGESLDEVRKRAVTALTSVCKREAREVIVVSHGAVIQAVCAHVTAEWHESFVPPNCGFTIIEHHGCLEPGRAWLQQLPPGDVTQES